ncbi:MAG: hypothetical protein K5985_06525 [Lachnospiraceae bacterium]|nr:hypothetical protein [Lachnospiraceae bacterium]
MKGLSKKDIPVLVLCLSAVLLVAVYCFVWTNGREKIKELKDSNEKFAADIEELKEKSGNRQYYEDQTALMQEEIDAIYSYFPADVLMEDGIVSSVELEAEAPMIGGGIGYSPAVEVYTVGQGGPEGSSGTETQSGSDETDIEEDAEAARTGGATYYSDAGEVEFAEAALPSGYVGEYGPITLRNTIFTYTFETSYSGFKNIVDYFVYLPGRSTIGNVSLGFDSNTGLLNGTATVNRYSLTGTGKIYQQPEFPSVVTGRQNIFGSLELVGGGGASETGEESEEESE